jgi:hypothetical protein
MPHENRSGERSLTYVCQGKSSRQCERPRKVKKYIVAKVSKEV